MLSHDLHGKTLGIVGLGAIGTGGGAAGDGLQHAGALLVAARASRRRRQRWASQWRELPDLLRESDYVSITWR